MRTDADLTYPDIRRELLSLTRIIATRTSPLDPEDVSLVTDRFLEDWELDVDAASAVGVFLYADEVECVSRLAAKIGVLMRAHGWQRPSSYYCGTPEWGEVVSLAERVVHLLSARDDG